uniref:Retrovirus-related Pol polyprotein from transposon TNT 1-94 n=1 Tax=Tanacetum cinerariifolium TaxID=118510 RepID=A0A6L2MNQ9_TANCI|nr:retrovirus-related Pol polyprotein from transposon TNT 1-94 [Tanacetum cinerariifolium]
MEPYYLKCIKDGPFQPKTAEGDAKPESQWTLDERRVVVQDQRLKSIIMSCLPDDIMKYVISCVSAKEMWTDLDFQENSDDKIEERFSEEYLRDLDIEYHEIALLENSKRFIKRRNNFSVFKGFQPKFTPKLIQSSSNSSNQADRKFQKDYKAEYKKMKAKLALLEASPSSPQTRKYFQPKNKGLIAETLDWDEEENHARNDKWADITMRKVNTLLSMDEDADWKNYLKILVPEIQAVNESFETLNTLESSKDSKLNSLLHYLPRKTFRELHRAQRKKSQAPKMITSFIRMVENQNIQVKQIRTDNGTEFRNHELESFCDEKGISQNFPSPYTPEQNGVPERKNRTLIEATRTMLNGSNDQKITQPTDAPSRNNTKGHGPITKPLVPDVSQSHIPNQASTSSHPAPRDRWSRDQHIELVNIIVARIEAIRIFFAFATYMNFKVYQMDVKSAFLNGKLKEEVYVKQPPSFESSEFPDYVFKLDKALYGLKQAPKACSSVITLMIPPNNLGPDLAGKQVNETSYREMIGSLMYLTATRTDIQFFTVLCVRYQSSPKESHLTVVKRILRYLKEKALQVPVKYLVKNWFVGVSRNNSQWLCHHLKLNMLLLLGVVQDKIFGFLPPILSNSNFTKDPFKVTDIELTAHMIVVNNRRDSVSLPSLAEKPKKGKSRTVTSTLHKSFGPEASGHSLRRAKDLSPKIHPLRPYTGLPSTLDEGTRKSKPLPESTATHPKDFRGNKQPLDRDITSTTPDKGTSKMTPRPEGSLGDKDSKGNIPPADMEPIHTLVALLSILQGLVLTFLISEDELEKESDEEEVLSAEDAETDELVASSMSSLKKSSSSISDLYKGLNVITELLKDINNAVKDGTVTNKKIDNAIKTFAKISTQTTKILSLVKTFDFATLQYTMQDLQAHALIQKEASAAWTKSSTNMAWNLGSRMTAAFKGQPSSAPSGSVTPTLALTHILANVEGENATTTATEENPSHTEGETGDTTMAIPISSIHPTEIVTKSEDDPSKKVMHGSTMSFPDPDEPIRVEFMNNGKIVYLTEQEIQEYWDKEEKMKKATKETKLLAMSRPEVIKKAQDVEHDVLKREHSKKANRLTELNRRRAEEYMWTMANRIKPEPITDARIHPNTKPIKIPEELGIQYALHASIPEQVSSQTSGRKRKHMELKPEIKVPGLECNRSLPEGVPFVSNMVIEEPEYEIFFTYVFGDQAFQIWDDIHKDPFKVTDIELMAHMIDVNNQRDSVSLPYLAAKPKKRKSQTVTSTLPKSQGPKASRALSKKRKNLISSCTVPDPQDLERDIQLDSTRLPSTLNEGTRKSKPLHESTATHPKDSGGNKQPFDRDITSTTFDEGTAKTTSRPEGSLGDKDSKGNIPPIDMEPILILVAVFLILQGLPSYYSEDELEKESNEEEVLAAGDDMDEDSQDDAEEQHKEAAVSYPDLKASIEEYYKENIAHRDQTDQLIASSMSSLEKSSSSISDLYKGLNVITELLKYINNAVKDGTATNKKIDKAIKTFAKFSAQTTKILLLVKTFDFATLQYTMQDLQTHALKQEEASAAWTKSSTNMAWNLGLRMTTIGISQTALKSKVSPLRQDTSKIKSMMAEIYQAFKRQPSSAPSGTQESHYESSQATLGIDKGKGITTESEDDPSKKLMHASTIICPNPDELIRVEFMNNGKIVYFTEQEIQEYWDKEEKMKKAAEETKLLAMSRPEVIKIVHEEAKKLRIDPKEAISTKHGETFKKAQDAEHDVLKREHSKKVQSGKEKNSVVKDLMISLSRRYERLKKIPEELGIQSALPAAILEQVSSQTSGRKRKHIELKPEIKVHGLECNRSLPEGVPFVSNMVIEEPGYGIFLTNVFGDQAFQRWDDIHKLRKLIADYPDKEKLKSKKVKLEALGYHVE